MHSERLEQLLLNLSTTSNNSKSDSSNASGSEETTSDFERFRGPFLSMQDVDPQSDTTLSDVSSQPEHVTHPSLEECWIVTPPPCFTASESNTDLIQMHPFENLLIEHPSMSVYWPQEQLNFYSEDSLAVEAEGMIETQTLEDYNDQEAYRRIIDHQLESGRNEVVVYQRPMLVRRSRLMHPAPDVMANGRLRGNETETDGGGIQLVVCKSWSVEEEKGQKQFSNDRNTRKSLYQQNLVREYSSRGKIQPRKDRMVFPSGRSNNRKC